MNDGFSPEVALNNNLPNEFLIFDWTDSRKREVIKNSQRRLSDFLNRERKGQKIGESLKTVVEGLYNQVLTCFQNGVEIGGYRFQKNALPAHSEYHIAKVLTLVTELFDHCQSDYQTQENALAVSLAAIIHDLGSLLQEGEKGPQERYYQDHEQRAINLVDSILNSLPFEDNELKQRLISKVKLLIYATRVDLNMIFGMPAKEASFERTKLYQLISSDQASLSEEDKKKYQDFLNILEQLKGEQIEELVKIMGAADHGAYLLEPCRLIEIIGLWQELNNLWEEENGEIAYRGRNISQKHYLEWLCSDFPDRQKVIYGQLLKTIGVNPFFSQKSIEETFSDIDNLKEGLKQKQKQDGLVRFEGFFSPAQLLKIVEDFVSHIERKIDEKIKKIEDDSSINETEKNKKIEEEKRKMSDLINVLIEFSKRFSGQLHLPDDFDALATSVLRKIYQALPKEQRVAFFQKALEIICQQETYELTDTGFFNLHFAPYAYIDGTEETVEEVMQEFALAINSLPENQRKRLRKVYLTLRQDKGDSLEKLIELATKTEIVSLDGKSKEEESPKTEKKDYFFGIAIGGIPTKDFSFQNALEKLQQAGLEAVIHLGVEENQETMNKHLDEILFLANVSFCSLHINGHFDWFLNYYDHLGRQNREEDRQKLKEILKMVSPFNYLINGLNTEILKRFFQEFPDTLAVTNNPCLLGDMALAVQNFAKMRLQEMN